MFEVTDRLFVGDDSDCAPTDDNWATVHACKHNCHQNAVGYTGTLSQDHPHYLVLERERDLYLNMIDPDRPLFPDELFEAARHALRTVMTAKGTSMRLLQFLGHIEENDSEISTRCSNDQALSKRV